MCILKVENSEVTRLQVYSSSLGSKAWIMLSSVLASPSNFQQLLINKNITCIMYGNRRVRALSSFTGMEDVKSIPEGPGFDSQITRPARNVWDKVKMIISHKYLQGILTLDTI